MKKLLWLFTLVCSSCCVFAQDVKEIQQLRKEIAHLPVSPAADTARADLLYQLSKAYWSNDLDTAMLLTRQSLDFSEKTSYRRGKSNAYHGLGVIYWYKGEYDTALVYNQRALETRKQNNDTIGQGDSYNNIGLLYDDQGDFPNALKYYLEALDQYEQGKDQEGIAQEYNNIGIIHYNQHNYREALTNLNKALQLRLRDNDKWALSECYSNIGLCYFELGNDAEMKKNYDLALQLRREIGDQSGIAISFNNFGEYYKKRGDYEKALQTYDSALVINEAIGYKKSMVNVELNIGSVYELQQKTDIALAHVMKALAYANEIGAKDYLIKVYETLSRIYSEKNNFREAYRYHVLYQQTNDSLFSSSRAKALTKMQLEYDFEKKLLCDSLQFAQEKRVGEVRLERQKTLTYGGFGALGVVIALLVLVYVNYNKQIVANKKLKAAQQQLIESEKMAAFGVLTTRVAHEIQNPLNFVNNFSQLNEDLVNELRATTDEQERTEVSEALMNNCRKIHHHGKRAEAIVRRLQEHLRAGTAHRFFEDGTE